MLAAMRIRVIAWLVLATGCFGRLPGASRPEVTTGGTWSCQQIVEQCDVSCQSPACLDDCTAHGTPDAQQQHNAVVSCGQRALCTDEACMRAHCSDEMTACAPDTPPTADPAVPPPPAP